jgi:hypothetical protein
MSLIFSILKEKQKVFDEKGRVAGSDLYLMTRRIDSSAKSPEAMQASTSVTSARSACLRLVKAQDHKSDLPPISQHLDRNTYLRC